MNFWGPEGYYQLGRDLCEGIEWEKLDDLLGVI